MPNNLMKEIFQEIKVLSLTSAQMFVKSVQSACAILIWLKFQKQSFVFADLDLKKKKHKAK